MEKVERTEASFINWGNGVDSNIKEFLMDHIVAWSLKCATKEGEKEYGKEVSKYSRKILSMFLFGKEHIDKINMDYEIESLEIWREWNNLDIVVEIELLNKKDITSIEKHILFIENKTHTHTDINQVNKYIKSYKESYLENETKKDFKPTFILLGVWDDEVHSFDSKCCEGTEFKIYTMQDILDEVFQLEDNKVLSTGNFVFDGFWTGRW